MKILEEPVVKLPKRGMDDECVDLCNLLNRLPGLKTSESCCGHCKAPFCVFFSCDNLDTLTRLGRVVDNRYSDGKWEIVLETGDSHPKNRFWLRSKEAFKDSDEMMLSTQDMIDNIGYWFDDRFDKYFDTDGMCSSTNEDVEDKRPLSWTTVEESERLLDCGFSEDTADALYEFALIWEPSWVFLPVSRVQNDECETETIPCWTLGTLMRMLTNDYPKWNVTMTGQEVFIANGIWETSFLKKELIRNVVDALEYMATVENPYSKVMTNYCL